MGTSLPVHERPCLDLLARFFFESLPKKRFCMLYAVGREAINPRKSRQIMTQETGSCSGRIVEIIPSCLYLSDLEASRDMQQRRHQGITHTVNSTGEEGNERSDAYHVAVLDDIETDLLPLLDGVCDWIHAQTSRNNRVLVHWYGGACLFWKIQC